MEYAFPKAVTKLTVIQTLGCAPDPGSAKDILSAVSVTPSTAYLADNAAPKGHINLGKFRHDLVDPDLDINLSDDGRLKSINATMTGSGTAVVKAAIALGALVATFGGDKETPRQKAIKQICQSIQNISNAQNGSTDSQQASAAPPAASGSSTSSQPNTANPQQKDDSKQTKSPNLITLTYVLTLTYTGNASGITSITPDVSMPTTQDNGHSSSCAPGLYIPADPNTIGVLSDESPLLQMAGSFCVNMIAPSIAHANSVQWTGPTPSDFTPIDLPHVFTVTLAVSGLTGSTNVSKVSEMAELWRGVVTVPVSSAPYQILVPTGTAFGSEKFTLQLGDDGAITEIRYGASGGASDAGTAFQSIAQALPTNESKANDLSAQSDLIYEQQRLVTCKLTPDKCASK
jgi:hypothetical protein